MTNDGSSRMHVPAAASCAATICEVDIEPAYRNTATNDRPIAIS